MNHLTPRSGFVVSALALFILGIGLVYLPVSRAERSTAARTVKSQPPQDPAVLAQQSTQAVSATNGKIAFESNRIAGIFKIFTVNPDGTPG